MIDPTVIKKEPITPDFEVCEQSFLHSITRQRAQKYFTIREYKVLGSDLTSLLGKH